MQLLDIIHEVGAKYQFVECQSDEEVAKCKSVRYKVFCEEKEWLEQSSPLLENDEFDQYSKHFLVVERDTETPVGTFRLILGNKLPLMEHISKEHILLPSIVSGPGACEISRLSLLKEHRSEISLTTVFLIFVGFRTANENITGSYAVMEKRLAKKIKKLGCNCAQITKDFHYNGNRAVYYMSNLDLLNPLVQEFGIEHGFDELRLNDAFRPIQQATASIAA